MRQPSLDVLMKKTDSKYALVVAVAKRARMLTAGSDTLLEEEESEIFKPVSVALEEVAEGKVEIESPKGGIK